MAKDDTITIVGLDRTERKVPRYSDNPLYQRNKEVAVEKEKKADYEAFGSHGDAARKGMEEGRMDEMGTAYKKGGKVKSSASKRADGCCVKGKTKGRMV
jgi:hypothetical protein